jgi:hypothetical protein
MKIECSCGAKYEFEVGEEMRVHPVKFVCPSCGFDASEFVDGLVRRELGQSSTPSGIPVPIVLNAQTAAKTAPLSLARTPSSTNSIEQPGAQEPQSDINKEAPLCLKHPGEIASNRCYICSKPICPKCMELFGYVCSPLCKAKADSHGVQIPVYEGQKSAVEARLWRKVTWIGTAVAATLAILLGLWFWYVWFGCAPKPIFSVRFPERSYSGQSAIGGNQRDQIVFLHGVTLARYDLKSGKEIWSRQMVDREQIQRAIDRQLQATKAIIDKANSEAWDQVPKMPSPEKLSQMMEREAAAELALHVRGQNIWVSAPNKLARYDWDTGKPLAELPVRGGMGDLIQRGNELLLVDTASGKTVVTHIDLVSGETRKEELSEPDAGLLAENTAGGNGTGPDLNLRSAPRANAGLPLSATDKNAGQPIDPAKAAEQAQHMSLPQRLALPAVLAGNMNQQRALKELNDQPRSTPPAQPTIHAESNFSLIPTRDGFVEQSVKLLESHIVTRSAMKAGSGKSVLDGDVTAGKSMDMASDMLNEMQRSNGGDLVQEDHSRYEVTLRRPGSAEAWTGEVIGPPRLFPLETVNVLAADKLIIVLDKANKKLWQSSLNYNIVAGMGGVDDESATYGQGPCVERKGSLYVFDQGVLTAFDLATGNARWRFPTVGIAGIFFDDHDNMYVNTSTASYESLKYSRQIDLSRNVISVVLKLDSRNGKTIWSNQSVGLVNYVSGKLVLTAQSYMPEERDEDSPGADTGFEKSPWLRIRRINPKNGREVWDHFQERAPLDIAFDQNTIRLVFKKEVQVLRFPRL